MPKYYCEYCDIYLTHSSPGGRRQHNAGRKHINNKIDYFFNLIRNPKFVPPAHVLESGLFGGMNVIMGSRPPILPQNIGIPGILRPPSMNPMVPWGNSMFMRGRGAPMPPMVGVANPMMMPGRNGSNVVMPPHGYQPKLFERPPFS